MACSENQRLTSCFQQTQGAQKKPHPRSRVGEELETRGWKVGITTLKKQPRAMVWDRMLAADVCLITSTRESGPLCGKGEWVNIVYGCPVVAVDVGDMGEWMEVCSPKNRRSGSLYELADAVICGTRLGDNNQEVTLPQEISNLRDQNSKWLQRLVNGILCWNQCMVHGI